MEEQRYEKVLTANDTGETGGHQAGIHIPKSHTDLLAFLPKLDSARKNPDVWLEMTDDEGIAWQFRYIHYNNKLHDNRGTRDEYRITHMTRYFRSVGAVGGDVMVLSGSPGANNYSISILKAENGPSSEAGTSVRIRLKGWRRIH